MYNLKGQRDLHSKYIELYKDYNREREFRLATKQRQNHDPVADEQCFQSIEKIYLDTKKVSQCEDHVIFNLPAASLDEDYIISEKNRLKKQLTVVSRKVSELMLHHQPEYNEELQRVMNLQILLNDAINLTAKSRANLKLFKSNVTISALSIIRQERRRHNACQLLECLQRRREYLMSNSPSHEVNETKEDADSDQLNNSGSGTSSHMNSPESKASPIKISISSELQRTLNCESNVPDAPNHSNLPYTNSYDSLLTSTSDKATASTTSALDVRSNSLTPVPQVASVSDRTYSPASR